MTKTTLHEYRCVCHGCGRIHTVRSLFLSTDTVFAANGLPAGRHTCGECPPETIRNAYSNGMNDAARLRFDAEAVAYKQALAGEGHAVGASSPSQSSAEPVPTGMRFCYRYDHMADAQAHAERLHSDGCGTQIRCVGAMYEVWRTSAPVAREAR